MSVSPPGALRAGGWSLLLALLALAAWLGAALYFSAVVARGAFVALPNRTLAGALVGQILPALLDAGIVAGLWLAAVSFLTRPGLVRSASRYGGLGVAALCGVARFVILARIAELRRSMAVTVDALQPGDPMRRAFGELHALSVGALGLAMLIALGAAVIVAHSFAVVEHD